MTIDQLIKGIEARDRVALARAITIVENESDGYVDLLDNAYRLRKPSFRIGITGPPGAGKSTLISSLAQKMANSSDLAVVAVDPTSPFSGGAILGDRIRMSGLAQKYGVFIRSMASRGSLGGLSLATENVLTLFEAFGMDYIIVETIGVGQVEVDVARACDTIVLVLVPESGDGVQVMKAGLIEIGDIIVVNKADRDGADLLFRELNTMLQMAPKTWPVPILKTVATRDQGVDELLSIIERHYGFLKSSGGLEARQKLRIRATLNNLIAEEVKEMVKERVTDKDIDKTVDKIYHGSLSPFKALDLIFNRG